MAHKKLVAGEKVKIHDHVSSQSYEIQIHIESAMTIDVCCFGLDADKKLSDDRYLVFYNQINSPEKAISLTANGPRKTVFTIALNKLPAHIKSLVFTAAIDGNGTMSTIGKSCLTLFVDGNNSIRFDFSGQDFQQERAIMIGEIYFKEVWRLGAVGQGFNGGLSALLKHFGGEEMVEPSANGASMLSNGCKYYYQTLDTPMRQAYEAMVAGIRGYADSIYLNPYGGLHESSLSDLVSYVKLDNPELFYLASQYQFSVEGQAIWYKPQYLYDSATIQAMAYRLVSVADNIVNGFIHSAMTDYEKEWALHDYLAKNLVYDSASLALQNPSPEIYTAYGALVNQRAVCSGFANAMKLLLDRCGIDCLVVTGDSNLPDSNVMVGHAWNIVKINRQYYHLDVTWDAPINKAPGEVFHYYFNVTDQEIAIDHQWQRDVPSCYATEYNYFVYQGLNVSNDVALKQWLLDVIANRNPTWVFKYSGGNSTMDGDKLSAMIGDSWKQFGYNSLSWSMSYNDRQKIFNVEFSYG